MNGTPKPSPLISQNERLLAILEQSQKALSQALQSHQKLSQQLAQLASEQSQQIAAVLQERFYRPVLSEADRERQTHDVGVDAPLVDVATFDESRDGTNASADNEALETASAALEEALEAGFQEILDEHQAAHAGEPEPEEVPA